MEHQIAVTRGTKMLKWLNERVVLIPESQGLDWYAPRWYPVLVGCIWVVAITLFLAGCEKKDDSTPMPDPKFEEGQRVEHKVKDRGSGVISNRVRGWWNNGDRWFYFVQWEESLLIHKYDDVYERVDTTKEPEGLLKEADQRPD